MAWPWKHERIPQEQQQGRSRQHVEYNSDEQSRMSGGPSQQPPPILARFNSRSMMAAAPDAALRSPRPYLPASQGAHRWPRGARAQRRGGSRHQTQLHLALPPSLYHAHSKEVPQKERAKGEGRKGPIGASNPAPAAPPLYKTLCPSFAGSVHPSHPRSIALFCLSQPSVPFHSRVP